MSDIMTVQGLDLWYGDHQALHDISMNIPEKSITALIGPSGCGKSTFLKTLNRMNDLIPGVKITGDVRYRDQDIFAPGTDVNELRREIGMVFQKPNPFPMSVYDNIAKHAGAGTLVPITGFANAIAAPAVEFKTEGFVLGVGAKMFTIAGPVIVYGLAASVVYGFIYWLYTIL